MIQEEIINAIWNGYLSYWNMLGALRGNIKYKVGVAEYLKGDITWGYAIDLLGIDDKDKEKEIQKIIKQIENNEIPAQGYCFSPMYVDNIKYFTQSKNFEIGINYGMAKKLSKDIIYSKCDKRINIFRVLEISQLKTAGAILNSVFEYDLFSFEHFIDIFNTPNVRIYLAEYNGLPVSALMCNLNNEVLEIHWLGTLLGFRGKGIEKNLLFRVEQDFIQEGCIVSLITAFKSAVEAYQHAGYTKSYEFHNKLQK